MNQGFKRMISVACILFISGFAVANCGKCPNDKKKSCPVEGKKVCSAKDKCPIDSENCIIGNKAPDFTLKDLDGNDVQLSAFKGKIVVLEWTNYDCPFVKDHYGSDKKTTSTLAKKYADKGVKWMVINSTHYTTADATKAWAKKVGLNQTVLIDTDGKVGKLYKAKTTPHVFVIDKEGKVAYQGAVDNAPMGKAPEGEDSVNYVDKAISELLTGKEVETPVTKPYGCSVKYAKK
jgi:peroxiredoxin